MRGRKSDQVGSLQFHQINETKLYLKFELKLGSGTRAVACVNAECRSKVAPMHSLSVRPDSTLTKTLASNLITAIFVNLILIFFLMFF